MAKLKALWARFWALPWRYKGPVLGVLGVVLVTAALLDSEKAADTTPAKAETTVEATATLTPTPKQAPTSTPTPEPTAIPSPTPTATPTPQPVSLSGAGQAATEKVELASGVWKVALTHGGRSNFIVRAYGDGGQTEFLTNEIGQYSGTRMLVGDAAYIFDVDADGTWTIDIVPVALQLEAALQFESVGDDVSGLFVPAGDGPTTFAFAHAGRRNFIVRLYCDKGTVLAQNEIGAVDATRVVAIPKGSSACLWEVQADGDWSITLKQ